MRPKSFVYIAAIVIPLCYMLYLSIFYQDLYWATLPEFIATSLGVIMSFSIARYLEVIDEQKKVRQVLNAIKKELQVNLEVIGKIRKIMKGELNLTQASFKTNTWNALNTMLTSVRNYEVVIRLAELYWKLDDINEIIRSATISGVLLELTGFSLVQAEKDINELIREIDQETGVKTE